MNFKVKSSRYIMAVSKARGTAKWNHWIRKDPPSGLRTQSFSETWSGSSYRKGPCCGPSRNCGLER